MPLYAGLDIGTTHTKLIICDSTVNILFQAKQGYTKGFGDTLDCIEIRDIVTALFLKAVDSGVCTDQHLVVTLSTAMHSLVLLNEAAEPQTALYTWADTRSQPVVRELENDAAVHQLFFETGTPFHPMSPLCKLAWMHRSTPELLRKACKTVGIKEYLWYTITGQWEVDYSIASASGLFSQKTMEWHPEALELAGIGEHQLAVPVPVTRSANSSFGDFTSACGLPEDTVWVIGSSDGVLAQIGSGALSSGVASLTIGTSGAIRVTIPAFITDPQKELFTYHLDSEHAVSGAAINNGGIVLQWWQRQVMELTNDLPAALENFTASAASVVPGCEGLVCLPWFGGERAPVWNAEATGIFAGVRNTHGQAHFKRAIIEGICFSFRLLLEKLEASFGPIHTIYAGGGFTASKWWVRLLADILQRPLILRDDADASALGAIATGMKSRGAIEHWEDFAKLVSGKTELYNPDIHANTAYLNNYGLFLRLSRF